MSNNQIFVCYEKSDRAHVDALYSENLNNTNEITLWAAHVNGIPVGKDFPKEIENKIESSKGAILFVSNAFLNSEFINKFELPRIFDKQNKDENYKISINLVEEDCDYSQNTYLKNKQFTLTKSKALKNLDRGFYSLALKQILEVFKETDSINDVEAKKKIEFLEKENARQLRLRRQERELLSRQGPPKKNPLSTLFKRYFIYASLSYLGIFLGVSFFTGQSFNSILINTLEDFNNSGTQETQDLIINTRVENSDNIETREENFLLYLKNNLTDDSVGYITLFSDFDLLNKGSWICDTLEKNVQHYFVYDGLWFLIAQDLNKYNVAGEEMTAEQMGAGQYYIFHGANDFLCGTPVDVSSLEQKYNLHKYITNDEAVWRSSLWRDQISGGYLDYLLELLDTNTPSNSLLGYLESTDGFYELLIEGCNVLLPLEPEKYLDFINEDFSSAKSLEEQNEKWDFQDVVLLIVTPIFCPEYTEKGVQLNTYIYLADFKYNY